MATSSFGGLGLGELGSEKKYFANPEKAPGILQAAVNIPKTYIAKTLADPIVSWFEKTFGDAPEGSAVPPSMQPVGVDPRVNPYVLQNQYNMYNNPNAVLPETIDDPAHTKSNPWM
jgi:hypothetical protein